MKKIEFVCSDPGRPEFRRIFGGWLTEHGGRAFLVDCGVGGGAGALVAEVKEHLGGRPLNYVLLTHIHLDHAGGLGEIVKAWPEVKVLAHDKGLRYLVSPGRLWASTREVMGELAEMYGEPAPMDPARLIPHSQADLAGLKIIETPGHASHHLSFRLGETMFVGEAAGCPLLIDGRIYNRPATPPRHYPEAMSASVARLLEEPDGPAYFGHIDYPIAFHDCLRAYQRQLKFWNDLTSGPEAALRPGESAGQRLDRLLDIIIGHDPDSIPFEKLSPLENWRERYFARNALEGLLDYYENSAPAAAVANGPG
ncbi:MAG: MBL fold metallo-hydrolase [Candidatus Adiutrix sp.]|jgi:glyoxylase-like metal-dependent hydrolase (beta-lactamase superfamily II)|nr:MBL fold metallo-hydrolase [Candidatus Adiutrix sp.]